MYKFTNSNAVVIHFLLVKLTGILKLDINKFFFKLIRIQIFLNMF